MGFVCKLAMTSAATLEVRTYANTKYIPHTESEFVTLMIKDMQLDRVAYFPLSVSV